MKYTRTLPLIAFSLLTLTGCGDAPLPQAYQIQNSPEKLMTVVSDTVRIDLGQKNYTEQLTDMLSDNPPTRAVLHCIATTKACKNAARILTRNKIVTENGGSGNDVALVYEHTEARDCNQRYVDNSINEDNLNYESLGCATTANIAQMVTDKRQFTKPNMLDYQDGEKAATTYDTYTNPPATSGSSSGGGGSSNGISSSLVSGSSGQ